MTNSDIEKTMQNVATRFVRRIIGGHSINGEFISGMAAGLQCSGFPELSDALIDWETLSPAALSNCINRWAGEVVLNSDLTLAV
jgi:hypothetical protein